MLFFAVRGPQLVHNKSRGEGGTLVRAGDEVNSLALHFGALLERHLRQGWRVSRRSGQGANELVDGRCVTF